MEKAFEMIERLLSEERAFLRPDFSVERLCAEVSADEKDMDGFLTEHFGITLRGMIWLYAKIHFRSLLGEDTSKIGVGLFDD